jgi:hypothetical protein
VGSAALARSGMVISWRSGCSEEVSPSDLGGSMASALVTEPKRTLRSVVSDILLSSVTKDSPHQALCRVSLGGLLGRLGSAYLVYFLTYFDSFW